MVAELQGNSGLAGGAGAVVGEIAADIIRKQLYGKDVKELTEEEKETISALSQLASGLAVAAGGGNIGDASAAISSSKNAVENNYLKQETMLSLDKEMAECKSKGGNCDEIVQKYIDISNENSMELQKQCSDGGILCVTIEEFVQSLLGFSQASSDRFIFGEIMKDEHAKALAQILNGADLKFLSQKISTTDRVLAIVTDPYSWPFLIYGSKNIIVNLVNKPKGTIGIATIVGGTNAGIQYAFDGNVKLSDLIGAGFTAMITKGKGYNATINWNTVNGYYTAKINGDDPLTGAIISRTGSGVGYWFGNKIKSPLDKIFNKVSKKYEMQPTGIWTITKPIPPSNVPSAMGNLGDSIISGSTSKWLEKKSESKIKGK